MTSMKICALTRRPTYCSVYLAATKHFSKLNLNGLHHVSNLQQSEIECLVGLVWSLRLEPCIVSLLIFLYLV